MGASCSHEEDALVPYQSRQRLISRNLEDWRKQRFENNPEFCPFAHLARPLNVLREGIVARKDNEPVLLLGPVIGRVTDTTASFMLEVSEEIDVNITLVQVNGHRGPFDRHISSMGPTQDFADQPSLLSLELDRTFFLAKSAVCTAQRLKPGSPGTFQLQGLEPDSPYMVFISNIPEAEMKGPLRFRTMPLRVETFRIVAIGDYAASHFGTMSMEDENADPWMELQKTVKAQAEVQVAVHVGRSFAAQILDEICDALMEHQSFCEGPKQAKVTEARDLLRESYRATLGGHPQFRTILAQMCSNVSVFMPPLDIATLLERVWDLEDQAKRGADTSLLLGDLHQLLCLALEVYREYQRAMWDGSFHEGLHSLLLGQGWLNVPVPKLGEEELASSSEEYLVDAGQISDSVEEWHIHRYGFITILVLDTKGNAMTAALTGMKSKSILSERQWDAVEEALADNAVQVLLLVSDMPLVLEESDAPKVEEAKAEDLPVPGDLLRHGRWTMSWDMAAGIWDAPGAEEGSGNGSQVSWKSSERILEVKEADTTFDNKLAQVVSVIGAQSSSKEAGNLGAHELSSKDPEDVAQEPPTEAALEPHSDKVVSGDKEKEATQEVAEGEQKTQPGKHDAEEALEPPDQGDTDFEAGFEAGGGRSPMTWRESRQEQERLLEMLFEWKQEQEPGREVVLVNGADFSGTGTLHDTRLNMSIPVVLAGAVETNMPSTMASWKLEGQLPGNRFQYSYEHAPTDHWSFPVLDIDLRRESHVDVKISTVTGRRKRHDLLSQHGVSLRGPSHRGPSRRGLPQRGPRGFFTE